MVYTREAHRMKCMPERPGGTLSGSFSRLSLYIILSGWLSFGV
jgi:hypothetical protein